jgi:hypothetical protein
MRIAGRTNNFELAKAAALRGAGPEGESAYNKALIADRDQGNAKVFEAAQAQFGDLGPQRLLQNSEGHYYLPQSANPRRNAAEGDTNWIDPMIGQGPGVADMEGLTQAKGILGSSSGLAQADFYDMAMNRARTSQGAKPMQTRQDRMTDQHAGGYDAFDRAMRAFKG